MPKGRPAQSPIRKPIAGAGKPVNGTNRAALKAQLEKDVGTIDKMGAGIKQGNMAGGFTGKGQVAKGSTGPRGGRPVGMSGNGKTSTGVPGVLRGKTAMGQGVKGKFTGTSQPAMGASGARKSKAPVAKNPTKIVSFKDKLQNKKNGY